MSQGDKHALWFELSDGSNSVTVSFVESLEYSQSYSNIGGSSVTRMMSGRGVKQSNWSKLSTTISGSGMLPPGLSTLDYTGVLVLKCGAPRAVTSLTTSVALPAYRKDSYGNATSVVDFRLDDIYFPKAQAFLNGAWVPTSISLTGNVATCGTVAGASKYRVDYFPEMEVIVPEEPTDSFTLTGTQSFSWSLKAEQV